jgi:hypothetical protein
MRTGGGAKWRLPGDAIRLRDNHSPVRKPAPLSWAMR